MRGVTASVTLAAMTLPGAELLFILYDLSYAAGLIGFAQFEFLPLLTQFHQFTDYFSKISSDNLVASNLEAESFNCCNDFNLPNNVYPELDEPITVHEITTAVKSIKRLKSFSFHPKKNY